MLTRNRRRHGFTLVELLVVMSIIAMLAGLLLPAVNSVRETGRKTTCMNNIRNVAIAMQNFEAQRGFLPGWAQAQDARGMYNSSSIPSGVTGFRNISWVFPILPYLEKDDIFRAYSIPSPGDTTKVNANGTVMHAGVEPIEHVKILVCPNDTSALNNGTNFSYVANCGLRERGAASTGVDTAITANGGHWGERAPSAMIFNSRFRSIRGSIQNASSGDGASSTFLLSENMDAGRWVIDWEDHVGFCWSDVTTSPATTTTTAGTATMAPNHGPIGVNEANLPRASSYHPGGFVVAYADSHVGFLNSNIDWATYIRLFTPRGDSVMYRPYASDTVPTAPDIDTRQIQSTPLSETY